MDYVFHFGPILARWPLFLHGTILTIEPEGDDESGAAVIWISSDKEQNTEGPL